LSELLIKGSNIRVYISEWDIIGNIYPICR